MNISIEIEKIKNMISSFVNLAKLAGDSSLMYVENKKSFGLVRKEETSFSTLIITYYNDNNIIVEFVIDINRDFELNYELYKSNYNYYKSENSTFMSLKKTRYEFCNSNQEFYNFNEFKDFFDNFITKNIHLLIRKENDNV